MATEKSRVTARNRPAVFAVSCWVLALMAFSQILIAGMALATRFEESQVVRTVIKEVPKIVAVRVPAARPEPGPGTATGVFSPPPPQQPHALQTLPPPTPVSTPRIADPVTERLVKEARQARVAGDMGLAIMKLEESLNRSPEEPNVHFELGLVHEQMGVFDTAGAHFEKVYRMGTEAGSLYERAAAKIREGFVQPDNQGKLSIGRVQVFKDSNFQGGERVILTIPVQKAPDEDLDLDDISFRAHFFNRTSRGEVVELEDKSWVTEQKWLKLPFDFADGEETLRMTYVIPSRDMQTEHLFGEMTYYGQVIFLLYKGEILDVQAWPRELAVKIPQAPGSSPMPEFQDMLPNEYDPNLPLLPPLPGN